MLEYCPQCLTLMEFAEGKCSRCGTDLPPSDTQDQLQPEITEAPAIPVHLDPGTILLNRFKIGERIGAHGDITIYSASDTVQSQKVALKLAAALPGMPQQSVRLLQQEAQLHRHIDDHRHVLRAHDIHSAPWQGTELWILPMEYVDGPNVWQRLEACGNDLESRRRLGRECFRQVCLGVASLHNVGIVHPDLRLENLVFVGGVLKIASPGTLHRGLGLLDGVRIPIDLSPYITAPASQDPDVRDVIPANDADVSRDIASLGHLLSEILAPQPQEPLDGSRPLMRNPRHDADGSGPAASDSSDLQIIQRCLDESSAARFHSVAEILEVLENDLPAEEAPGQLRSYADEICRYAETAFSRRQLNESRRLCQIVTATFPKHPCARQLLEKVDARYDLTEEFYTAIAENLDRLGLDEIIELVQQAIHFYPDHPSSRLVTSQVVSRSARYRELMEAGRDALMARKWEAATACFQQSQAINPTASAPGKAIAFVVGVQHELAARHQQLDKAIQDRDFPRATELAQSVNEYLAAVQKAVQQASRARYMKNG